MLLLFQAPYPVCSQRESCLMLICSFLITWACLIPWPRCQVPATKACIFSPCLPVIAWVQVVPSWSDCPRMASLWGRVSTLSPVITVLGLLSTASRSNEIVVCSGGAQGLLRLGSSVNLETWYLFLNSEWSRVQGAFLLAWLPRDQFMSWANLFIFNEKQNCWRGRNVGVRTCSPGRKSAGKLYGLFGEKWIWEKEAKHLDMLRNPLPTAKCPLPPSCQLESVVTPLTFSWSWPGERSHLAQMVKDLSAMQQTQVQSLGWEDPLKNGILTPLFLCGEMEKTEEPGGLQSMGLQRVRCDFFFSFFFPLGFFFLFHYDPSPLVKTIFPWGHKELDMT